MLCWFHAWSRGECGSMCPLKREQARREMQQWVMRRLPTADSIVEIGRKSRSWIRLKLVHPVCRQTQLDWKRHLVHPNFIQIRSKQTRSTQFSVCSTRFEYVHVVLTPFALRADKIFNIFKNFKIFTQNYGQLNCTEHAECWFHAILMKAEQEQNEMVEPWASIVGVWGPGTRIGACYSAPIIQGGPKKPHTTLLSISLVNIDRFS